MACVDGFILAVPTKKLAEYRKLALNADKVWRNHGALEYRECAADDLNTPVGLPFPKVKPKRGELIVFSWIVYKSKQQRDKVNALVMKDPRICNMDPKNMPFDCSRMSWGGFKTLVDM